MEIFKIRNLSFTYPKREETALNEVNLSINQGEFVTVCGKSGCGKTTLLRLLKPALSPFGRIEGEILFCEKVLNDYSQREQAEKIGFVLQNPDNQIVTDKVWHELAFGLESLGFSTPEIRGRVSEMAAFFGIEEWFYKNVSELSGGQKQLLNLASVMVMQPSVIILDEPTSQLDPIAAQEFLQVLKKINLELGTTIIISEHRLEETFPVSDRVVVMDNGKIIADDTPKCVGEILRELNNDMYDALPSPMRIWSRVENDLECPVSVKEGRSWLREYSKTHTLNYENQDLEYAEKEEVAVELKNVWFRYDKNSCDIIKNTELKIFKGEIYAVLGGNGVGKTTLLSLISGSNTPYRGKVLINENPISEISGLYSGVLGVMPQDPKSLFAKKTVKLELMEMLSDCKMETAEKEEKIKQIAKLCRIESLLDYHPFDLSGGEQQRTALAKILIRRPQILLLDEPTKGLDAGFKKIFAEILRELTENGVTVIMVSHDIEFCAEYAHRCAMLFDGAITSQGMPKEFFSGKSFYTTAVSRMTRNILPDAVLVDEVVSACGGKPLSREQKSVLEYAFKEDESIRPEKIESDKGKKVKNHPVLGVIFSLLFLACCYLQFGNSLSVDITYIHLISMIMLGLAVGCFIPKRKSKIQNIQQPIKDRKLTKQNLVSVLTVLVAVPVTIFIGVFYLGDRKYYFISLMIIFEILIPFFMGFEGRKPQIRELIIISVLSAVAVAGRTAFYMLPQFKPVAALVIIAGVCFGGETGFLVGAITAFVSNFFFGQGPWVPWQMFAFGLIGFLSGILFRIGLIRGKKTSLSVFGFIATLVIYGGIINPSSLLMMQAEINAEAVISSYVMGFPFDLIHAVSTAFFLWFISEPMIEKMERVKSKYGLIGN